MSRVALAQPFPEKSGDGRIARRVNNRRRIVAAMLELVRGGAISPAAEEVAARAGVGLRTVFRHFDDMDSLYREMADAMRRELEPIVAAPLAATDWKGRLSEIVDRRVRLFERAMPFKNAADVHRHRSAFLRKDYAQLRSAERGALESAMPSQIANDQARLEALDLTLSFATWQHLRRDQRLNPERARETLEFMAHALAEAPGSSRGRGATRRRTCASKKGD